MWQSTCHILDPQTLCSSALAMCFVPTHFYIGKQWLTFPIKTEIRTQDGQNYSL